MGPRLIALVIGAVAGIAMAVQGTLNAALGKVIGLLEATFVVHVIGVALVAALLFGFRLGNGEWQRYAQAPWYVYLGGALGVVIIYAVVRSIADIGVANATTAIIVGQLFTASLIDHLGLLGMERIPFTWYRVVGGMLMASGAWLLLRK